MSDPIDTTRVAKYAAIQSALCELLSVESSLNMRPDPIDPDIIRTVDMWGRVTAEPKLLYTSTIDGNAKHAIEHAHAAFRLMNMAHHDQEGLKLQVFRLAEQLRELGATPKIKTWLDDL